MVKHLYRPNPNKYRFLGEKASYRTNVASRLTISQIESFCSKIIKSDWCWHLESKSSQRYITWRKHQAHRIAYELFIGPIPKRLVIDHLCENKKCINPEHMEPVTMLENSLRGNNSELHIYVR